MEIGPVRRRFTAEPVSSPVPAEAPGEPARGERVTPEHDAVPTPDVPVDLRS